jgi:tryptophanyl-tRNA synthetase
LIEADTLKTEINQEKRKRLFSGIQPSGKIHIGNYLGAIRQWAALQESFESLFCIVDLHAITVYQEPKDLRTRTLETAALLIASGIDPGKVRLFVQSRVSAHAEFAWILNCVTPYGWMQRMTQFKEKSTVEMGNFTVGLFDYPALMAADILLYETDVVPVGEDQKQHLELTRDVAQRFNTIYGNTFKIPEPLIPKTGARIMGLDDPTRKMSKSETSGGNALYLLDPPDEVRAKIGRARTDSRREVRFDETRPGINNLLMLYHLFTGEPKERIEARFEGKGYADFKTALSEVIIQHLKPIQARFSAIMEDRAYLETLLHQGAEGARQMAERVLRRVKEKMGLL